MTDTTTGTQPTPPAPSAPGPATPPAVAPAATNPATPPAPTGQPAPATEPPKPADPAAGKTFTQEQLDKILTDRLTRQEKAFNEKLAKFFGGDTGDGEKKPEDVLAQAQKLVETERARANHAAARSFAQAAQVKPERVDTLVGLLDLSTVLKGVDTSDAAAVDKAIKTAVEKKVGEFPEWKAGPALPGSSTANPNGAPGTPDLDARIAAATKAGNHREAIALKREKARQLSG